MSLNGFRWIKKLIKSKEYALYRPLTPETGVQVPVGLPLLAYVGRSSMNERLQKVIEHPFHKYLGVTTIESNSGAGKLSIAVNEKTVNPRGVLHGGVIYVLCDVCVYGGLLSLIDNKTEAVTHDIQVSVMQSAKIGDVVDFSSEIVHLGKRLCFIDVKAFVKGKIIASAKVTKSVLSMLT